MKREADAELPKLTAAHLRRADTMCARRLHHEHLGVRGNRRADARFRIANQLLDDARLCHIDARVPDPVHFRAADDLEPEQQRVYETAARWYVSLFGDRAVRSVELGFETLVAPLGVRLVGPAGLPVEGTDGSRELRLLNLGTGPLPPEPIEAPEVRFAILRVADWAGNGSLRVAVADLVRGELVEATVAVADELPALMEWLTARLDVVRGRISTPRPGAGIECGWCAFVAGCGAHPSR